LSQAPRQFLVLLQAGRLDGRADFTSGFGASAGQSRGGPSGAVSTSFVTVFCSNSFAGNGKPTYFRRRWGLEKKPFAEAV